MKHILLAIAAALSLTGCAVSDKTQAAEKGVAGFHEAMNGGQLAQIYDGSSNDMKQATSRSEFLKFLGAVRKKMGSFKSGKTAGWNVNTTPAGTYVTLNREAQFEKGSGTEQFVFRLDGERAILAGYHINSNALITN